MRTRPIALAAALAAPAALALAGCASTQNSAVDAAGPITVAASDTTCEVARTQAPAGQVEFTITNTGSKTNEFYVYAQGDRIMGEVEKVVDRIYVPGRKNPLTLKENAPAVILLAKARDEAHRFANFARKRLGKRARLRSDIDDIPGLGAAGKTLLRELGSMAAVRAATDEQILAVKGITK